MAKTVINLGKYRLKQYDVRDVYERELGILREAAQAAEAIEAALGEEAEEKGNQ